jgi:DNA-binding FadR family transcriptional regulator
MLFDTEDVREMIEVRERLETGFVGDAIAVLGEDNLQELRVLVEQMRVRATVGGYFLDKDLEFHCAIYRPLGNQVLMKLLDVFCTIYKNLRDRSLLITRDPVAEVENHAKILGAIEGKNAILARDLIREHFSSIKTRISATQLTPHQ